MMRKTDSRASALAARALASIALALLCGLASRAAAQDSSPERRQNLRRLMEVTKATDLGTQVIGESIAQIKTNLERLPPEVRSKISPEMMQRMLSVFEEELRREFTAEKMVEFISSIYEKHLTDEDIKGLIVFYETPLGRKMTDVLPQIMREAYEVGVRLGEKAAARAIQKLQAEGTLPGATVPPPPPKPQPQGNTAEPRSN